jgi:hypothetical protein
MASTELKKILNDPAKYPIFESVDDDAQLNYLGSSPNNNPRNENRKTRDDHRVSKTLTDMLWGNSSWLDWRIALYANRDDKDEWEGLPNGLSSTNAAAYNGNGLANTSKVGDYFTAATCPGVLMGYSEVLFIMAEAAHKGYIAGGDAQAGIYYDNAIHASYNHYGQALLDACTEATQYLNDTYGLGLDHTGWTLDDYAQDFLDNEDHAWDPSNAMKLIGEEKWVALYDQGLEAFAEWRRLDYPVLTPAAEGVLSGKMPMRVYYPSDESSRNNTNLSAAKSAQKITTDTDLLTKVWWDMK